jgi:KaiC/GvpD/RAD55 family RecA-like ATPase
MTITTKLEAALTYASWGWHVLPLVPNDKRPASAHGVHDATTDLDKIRAWWAQNPNYNIGIAAGEKSGIVVFDIDPRNGGSDSWDDFTSEHGGVPDGICQLTAGGGQHHIAEWREGLKSCELRPGVDFLANGRYFVVAPSSVNDREYTWEESSDPTDGICPFVIPESWLAAMAVRKVIVSATDGELITGNRNAGLASMAGSMRRSGFSASEIYAAIMTANTERCDIPLPLSDVKRIAESISRYEPEHDVGASTALGDAAAESLIGKDADVIEKLNAIFGDELGSDYEAPNELVEGLITIGSTVVVYGDSNSGKTFWALSVAASIAMGTTCYGRKTDPGLVVYLASESPTSIRSRVQAIKKHYSDNLENLVIVQAPVNFYQGDGDANDVIELVRKIEEIKGQSVRLIIPDTLARISAGANENSGEDMGPVMSRFDVVAAATRACIMIIHHNGKDAAKGSRGWSGIRAHIDTEIEVTEKDGVRSVTVTKQRELPSKGEAIYFKLQVIEMGRTKFGKPATTCVAIPDDESQEQTPHKPLTKHDQNVQLLERAWHASGAEMRNNCPYLSRSALMDVIVADGNSQRTAENKVAPGRKDGLIMPMLNAGVMRPFEHGWIFVNPQQTNAMLMLSNAKE